MHACMHAGTVRINTETPSKLIMGDIVSIESDNMRRHYASRRVLVCVNVNVYISHYRSADPVAGIPKAETLGVPPA